MDKLNYSEEIFKDHPNYVGIYRVSNMGNVQTCHSGKWKTLKPGICGKGYKYVHFQRSKKIETFRVHQLVAMLFMGFNGDGYRMVIDHINDIKTDNRVENLRVISQRENVSKSRRGVGSSKYVGVHLPKNSKKWRAVITHNKRKVNLGMFATEYEAHLAYEKALSEINQSEFGKSLIEIKE